MPPGSRRLILAPSGYFMSPIDQIPELIEQGKKFTYENFASKGSGGFPNALSTDWLVWTHEVTGILGEIDSGPVRSAIERGMNTKVLAYGLRQVSGRPSVNRFRPRSRASDLR
jgi:hypothetical protein